MKISFVIPCYRSEKTLEGVVAEIKTTVALRPEVDYEVIMVSDHSPDDVYSVIERLSRDDSVHFHGMELAKNFGQPSAQMAGFSRATGDVVFSLDDDGQAPVDELFKVVDRLNEGFDAVYGTYPHKKHNIFRNFGSEVNHRMGMSLIGVPRELHPTSFFALKKFVVDEMRKYIGPFPYMSGLIFRITKNVSWVDVNHRDRASGSSGYTLTKLVKLLINGFTAFSVKPLRMATWSGLLCAAAGFGFGAWTVVKKLFVAPGLPMGYSSLMAVLLFIGGMLMLMLGLIGEYIGRIYICINQAPQYVIARETGK